MKKNFLNCSCLTFFTLFFVSSAFAGSKNTFEGWYVGGHYGYGVGFVPLSVQNFFSVKYNESQDGTYSENYSSSAHLGTKGALGALHIGYHHLLSNSNLMGIELSQNFMGQFQGSKTCKDFYFSGNEESFGFVTDPQKTVVKKKNSSEVSIHMGRIFEHSFMSYLKLGLASTQWETKMTGTSRSYNIQASDHKQQRLIGGVIGIGSEKEILPKINLGIEANYAFYPHSSKLYLVDISNDEVISHSSTTKAYTKPKTIDIRLRLQWYID